MALSGSVFEIWHVTDRQTDRQTSAPFHDMATRSGPHNNGVVSWPRAMLYGIYGFMLHVYYVVSTNMLNCFKICCLTNLYTYIIHNFRAEIVETGNRSKVTVNNNKKLSYRKEAARCSLVEILSSLKVAQDWKWHHTSLFVFHCKFATIAISCIVSEVKPHIGSKSRLFNTTSIIITFWVKMVVNIFSLFSQPSQIPGLSGGVNRFCKTSSVCSQLKRVRETDGQTEMRPQ